MSSKYFYKSLLFPALSLLATTVWGQTMSFGLTDAIQYALDNNPNIKVAQLQITDAEWRIKENKATALPQISAGISYQYFLQRPGIPASALGFPGAGDEKVAFNAIHSLTPSLALNQLFFSNSYRVAVRAAEYYRQYVDEQLAVAKQTLRNQVIDAYLPALLISESLVTLDKNIANLEKLFSDTKAINQAGFAEQLDVDRIDLSLSTLRSERTNLVRQREIVVNALKLTLGMPVTQELLLTDDVSQLMTQYATVDLTAQLNYMNRPEYTQLLRGRELNVLQVELNRRPWIPTVSGFIQYQPGFQGGFGNDTKWFFIPSAVVGLSVNLPIWDGGGAKARTGRSVVALQTIDAQKQLLENALTLELENARRSYLNAAERMTNQQKNLTLAQRIYDNTQTKYKAGVGSSFEVTQAEQQLYTAQQNLMQAQYDQLSAKTAVQKALGIQ